MHPSGTPRNQDCANVSLLFSALPRYLFIHDTTRFLATNAAKYANMPVGVDDSLTSRFDSIPKEIQILLLVTYYILYTQQHSNFFTSSMFIPHLLLLVACCYAVASVCGTLYEICSRIQKILCFVHCLLV